MSQGDDTERLVIELKNIHPLELVEMADCLLSAGAEYQHFVGEHDGISASEEVKLLVREVRPGSAIFEVIAVCRNVLPNVFDHGKSLLDFLVNLRKLLNFLKGEESDEKPKFDKRRLDRVNRILQPTAKDSPGAQINFYYFEKGAKVADTINVTMQDANLVQNSIRRQMEALREPVAGYYENTVLYLYQTRDDSKSATGDKGVIERFGTSPVRTKFATEEAKAKVLSLESNIFKSAFEVDVRVDTIDNKPILYTVLRVHEILPRPRQESIELT